MVDDYATTYHTLRKLDNVYTHVTQQKPVEYLASCLVKNEVMVIRMYHLSISIVKWFFLDFSNKCLLFLFDICALFFASFGIPTPKFRVTCVKWCSRVFLIFMFLQILLHLLPKPNLTPPPIQSQHIWKTLAEQKRWMNHIYQTQAKIEKIILRIQVNMETLQKKLDNVQTWNTTYILSEHLKSLNASVEHKIKDTVRKTLLDSVLIELRDGKIILSPRLLFLLQDKHSIEKIYNYLKSISGNQLTEALDRVITIKMKQVQILIDKEIERYHQDNLNRADFAFMSRGGQILYHSPNYRSPILHLFRPDQAQAVIQPGRYIGECWSMKGSSGTIIIRLSENVQIDSITVEYPSLDIILSMKNAPKDILVYGSLFTDHWRWIGHVQYDVQGPCIQTFPIDNRESLSFRNVRLDIQSNWGDESHTDIYRIRIHGKPMLSIR